MNGLTKTIKPLALAITAAGLLAGPAQAQSTLRMDVSRADQDGVLMFEGNDARVPAEFADRRASAVTASGDYRADALISGYKWDMSTITYSFYEDDVFGGQYYGSQANVREVSDPIKNNVREIMNWYSKVLNVNFVEVAETSSNIGHVRIMLSDDPSYAYAYYPYTTTLFSLAGDVHLNPSYDYAGGTNGFQNSAGKHGYMSLAHEIGHAIGLKHPHDSSPNLPAGEDNISHTIMSYSFTGNSSGTPMAYDLMALHHLYGAGNHCSSNSTFDFTRTTDQYWVDGSLYINTPNMTKQTLWDAGGINTLDFSGLPANSNGYFFDINETGWLIPMNAYQTTYYSYGASVANGMKVHNILNSSSNDTIMANGLANRFGGYDPGRTTGSDLIYDASSADVLDLSLFNASDVTQSQNGNDLVLNLNGKGTVTLKDYYASSDRPAITFSSSAAPSLSISNVTVNEGNSGNVNATFTVSLSSISSDAVTVNYATRNGSAVAGSDYVAANGSITFSAGQTAKQINVAVIGDTNVENNETFYVDLSAATNATISDSVGVGSIINDDTAPNVAPTAVASASTTSGYAPLAINFSGTNSYDTDGSISSYLWTFGDGTSSTQATPSHTYNAAGTYTATLKVTDNNGATDTDTVTIQVQEVALVGMSVSDISLTTRRHKGGTIADAVISVRDANGNPVSGANVSVYWSGLVSGTSSATTGSNGTVTLSSSQTKSDGTFTITVNSIAKSGYSYNSGSNVETTDSISTTSDGGGNGKGNGKGPSKIAPRRGLTD